MSLSRELRGAEEKDESRYIRESQKRNDVGAKVGEVREKKQMRGVCVMFHHRLPHIYVLERLGGKVQKKRGQGTLAYKKHPAVITLTGGDLKTKSTFFDGQRNLDGAPGRVHCLDTYVLS